jgi:hypothetical protein
VTDATGHLPYWTLEQLAEGDLSHAERTLAEQHLRSCAHCSAQLDSARALIAALQALPAAAPSAHFSDAVMARVVIAPHAAAAASPAASRWLPRLTRGWVAVLALLLAPFAVLMGIGAWTGVSLVSGMGAVWQAVRGWTRDVAWNLIAEGTEMLIRSGLYQWGADLLNGIPGPTMAGLPVLLLMMLAAVPVSAWAMARLLRAPTTGLMHA